MIIAVTYIDPRSGAGRMNAATTGALASVIDVEGVEHLHYPTFSVDVGIIHASAADERGNLYMDQAAFDHGSIDVAMAAKNSGGIVIAEVGRLVERGDLPARMARIPGSMVDIVSVAVREPWEDESDPVILGATIHALPDPRPATLAREVVAEAAVGLVSDGGIVNLGAGIPMYDVPEAARRLGRDDIYLTVEQGPMGGWPRVGGVARNPEAILNQLDVFDFYEGGGPDVSILAFGEVDTAGNVNVSRFGDKMPGCGGFINITHGVRDLIFCGTLTSGGLDVRFEDGRAQVVTEGRHRRFVKSVQQMTFNAARALEAGTRVRVVTERALFEVTEGGYELTAIVTGIDLHRDVLERIPFPVRVSEDLRTVAPFAVTGAA